MAVLSVPKPVKKEKKVKRKSKKTPERKLIEEIDALDSMICLIINDFKCILCGGNANQIHHFFHKSNHGAVRFEPDNHTPVDFGCHNFVIHVKGDTEQLRDNIIADIGLFRFEELKKKSRELADRSIHYLQEELLKKQERLLEIVKIFPERVGKLSEAARKRLDKIKK